MFLGLVEEGFLGSVSLDLVEGGFLDEGFLGFVALDLVEQLIGWASRLKSVAQLSPVVGWIVLS